MPVSIPISWGELFDKITILRIKSQRIAAAAKLTNIIHELQLLTTIAATCPAAAGDAMVEELIAELTAVNETLWDIEDKIRDCERRRDFGPLFIELARSVYQTNDRRAALKLRLNQHLGSELIEEKSYHDY